MAGPNQVPGGTGETPNVFDQSANAYNQAMGIAQNNPGLLAQMEGFQNPYQQQVIDNAMTDLGRSHDLAQRDINSQAEAAGAFGGDRHGIQAGLANSEYMKSVGDLSANMNRQGFLDQAQLAGQDFNQRLQQLGALSGLSQQGFDMGRMLNQDQWQMGQEAQDLSQDIMDATGEQFAQNDILGWLGQLMTGMNQNPLSGNQTTEGTEGYDPSTGEKIMTGVGMVSQIPGFGK